MLQAEEIQLIRDSQKDSIAAKQLVLKQLNLIYANNWFNIWVPKDYGGAEYSFEQGLALLEELAYYDGGLAWTITLCSGANMFAGFIDPNTAKSIFSKSNVCFGGSGRAVGKAIWKDGSYYISGQWSFATGAPHLSHFTLNAPIYDGDIPRVDEQGRAVIYSFFVPKDYVLVHYDWNTFGLECTASHSFSLDKVKVESSNAFVLSPEMRYYDSTLYRIPFMPFAELTLLVNYLGMYRRFLDLTEKHFFDLSKDSYWAQKYSKLRFRTLDTLQQKNESDRSFVNQVIHKIWSLSSEGVINEGDPYLVDVSIQFKDIVESIRINVATMMPLLGIKGAQIEEEINVVFRNIFTAAQHSLLNVRAID